MKRFWKQAEVIAEAGGWGIALDGRPVRTPERAPLAVASKALAEAIAAEWDAQGEDIDPASMPLTGLANAAIDLASPDPAAFAEPIAAYAESDLFCYRDDRDAALKESDWFDTAKYPQARFTSESITKLADGSYEAAGQLEIKGTTKPATLAFTFSTGASGGNSKLDGTMTIDRFDFKVGQGWNDTSWVGQNVEVQIKLDLAP